MRYVGLLLLSLLAVGCGSDMGRDPSKSVGFFPPSIMTLTPNNVPVNSVPFTVSIAGNNFGSDAVVFWHGTPQFTTFVDSKTLVVTLTETDLMFAGLIPVYVRTGGLNSNTVTFNVTVQ